jgi:hypothetical protein
MVCQPRVKDGGIRFFLLKQLKGLTQGCGDQALVSHAPKQDAHVVAHQRVGSEH